MKNLAITLDEIRAELGEKMAHLLTNHFSGRRIQIPSFCDEACTLTAALGINASRILSERFGGGVIDVSNRERAPTPGNRSSSASRQEPRRHRAPGRLHAAVRVRCAGRTALSRPTQRGMSRESAAHQS